MTNELIDALKELQAVVHEMHMEAFETRDAMGKLATDSNLRSTLSLLRDDIAFRQMIYETSR